MRFRLVLFRMRLILLLILGTAPSGFVDGKYIEGEINTFENWAFITRFCFLADEGEFQFYIEYNEEQGEPNLLLYYDTDDQWPAVYKSNKTCKQKESVLGLGQNQVVNLTTRFPFREASGCVATRRETAPAPVYNVKVPTFRTRKPTIKRKATGEHTTAGKDETEVTLTSDALEVTTVTGEMTSSSVKYEVTGASGAPIGETDGATSAPIGETDGVTSALIGAAHELTSELFAVTTGTAVTPATAVTTATTTTAATKHVNATAVTAATTTSATTKYVKLEMTAKPIKKRSVRLGSDRLVVCKNSRHFRSSRERWWFVAISNCNGIRGIHLKYKILMTNGPSGDYWHEHFSADEFYVLPVLMAFSVAYSFLLLAIVICSVELKSRQLLHSTYKLFVLSAIVQFSGIIFRSMAYLKYAVNGIGSPPMKMTGAVFMSISETCFLLLMLLLAKGYTVTRGRLPMSAGIKLTIFMCVYVVTYLGLFIYEAKVFDPGEVLYTYESPAGYGLIILRIFAWCMFIYSTVFTLKHYPEKANFYYPFNIFGTLWFIAGPAFIISANTYIDKWVRESVVCAVLLFITLGGHLMFLLLTMPSVANKNFPYHVRTTQIGIMELTGHAGNNSIEQFGHHAYEPTGTGTERPVIVPLSRRTEEIFSGMYTQHMHSGLPARNDLEGPQRDVIMENVLSWSLAKKITEIGQFDPIRESIRRSPELPVLASAPDWVGEVPVELFTISKMLGNKQDIELEEPSQRSE